jgi:hypothetical protein
MKVLHVVPTYYPAVRQVRPECQVPVETVGQKAVVVVTRSSKRS